MSYGARAYVGSIITAGLGLLAYGIYGCTPADTGRFIAYLGIAILASGLKIRLPAVTGTMSTNFLFILIGVVDLSLGETLLIGWGASLVQSFWRAQVRPRPVQLLFNTASLTISAVASFAVYHSPIARSYHFEQPLLLLLAACTFFVTNTVIVATVIALTEGKALTAVWRMNYLWSFPYYLLGAPLAALFSKAIASFGWQTSLLVVPPIYAIYRSYRLYIDRLEEEKKRAEDERKHAEEMAALHLRTIETLALAIEAKDQTTHDHLQRVQVYALGIGKELGLSTTELQALQAASILHDVGKLAVPEYIITKPGKLTPEEFEKMKIHPVVGAELVERVQFPYPVAPIVCAHHEKWDGSGYPYGLKGEEIPIGARILSAVDCLDALATDRQYRRALPLPEAMKVVMKESGKAYDPRIVEILSRRYQELERIAQQSTAPERSKLSTELKIERGEAPAAGFEKSEEGLEITGDVQALLELARSVKVQGRYDKQLELLAARLRQSIPFTALAIYIKKGDRLISEFVTGPSGSLFSSMEITAGKGLSGWVAYHRKPIVNGNPAVEPGYADDPARFAALQSALAIPLEGPDAVIGVLSLYHFERDAFTKTHLRMLEAISTEIARLVSEPAPSPATLTKPKPRLDSPVLPSSSPRVTAHVG